MRKVPRWIGVVVILFGIVQVSFAALINSKANAAPQTVSSSAVADNHVQGVAGLYTKNNGLSPLLWTDGDLESTSGQRTGQIYLKFQASIPAGKQVTAAKLRLYSTKAVNTNYLVYRVANTSWIEGVGSSTNTAEQNWNNRPAFDPSVMATSNLLTTVNQYYDVNLPASNFSGGSGLYSFNVQTVSTSSVSFVSRQGNASQRPVLELTYDDTAVTPQVNVTTNPATSIAQTTAQISGSINSNVPLNGYYFEYQAPAPATAQTTTTVPLTSGTIFPVNGSVSLINLTPNTTYTYKLIATGSTGTYASSSRTFTTLAVPPPPPTQTTTVQYVASADNHTQSSSGLTTKNNGGSSLLWVANSSRPYLKFSPNIGSEETVVSARLILTPTITTSSPIVVSATSSNWEEMTQTWANQPALGSVLAQWPNMTTANAPTSVAIPASYFTDKAPSYSFALTTTGSSTSINSRHVSNASARPILEITKSRPTSTGGVTQLTDSNAVVTGSLAPAPGPLSYWFEYGVTTSFGNSTEPVNAESNGDPVNASSSIENLTPSTTYYYRLAGTNYPNQFVGKTRSFTTAPSPNAFQTVAVAGDTVCDPSQPTSLKYCQHMAVSNAILAEVNAGTVQHYINSGDLQYECGELQDFNTAYEGSYGRFKSLTIPTAGNHEYKRTEGGAPCGAAGAAGYFTYFGNAGVKVTDEENCLASCKGYYAKDVGNWKVIAINSNCNENFIEAGVTKQIGCAVGSQQYSWLVQQLQIASDANKCVAAVWHHPRYSDSEYGDNANTADIWALLRTYNSDLILNGHSHMYERFTKVGIPNAGSNFAKADAGGMRAFIVGSGGRGLIYDEVITNSVDHTVTGDNTSEKITKNTHGYLKLKMNPLSYEWEFVSVAYAGAPAGYSFSDTSTAPVACNTKN